MRNVLKRGIEEGESVDLKDRCKIYERILNYEIGLGKIGNMKFVKKVKDTLPSVDIDDWTRQGQGQGEQDDTKVSINDSSVLEGFVNDFVPEFYDQDDCGNKNKNDVKVFLNQLTKLSSIYHQLPSEFVSFRSIMKDCSSVMSPMDQFIKSIKSLSLETSLTTKTKDGEMPRAWTKLLRHGRPAVANLLDLAPNNEVKIAETIEANSPPQKSTKEKYANLLDLLD